MIDRYFIECRNCDRQVSLTVITEDDFQCPACNTMYHSEDGVLDKVLMDDMYNLYRGAKSAGLIKDKEIHEEFWQR
jgi:hypothetical protein